MDQRRTGYFLRRSRQAAITGGAAGRPQPIANDGIEAQPRGTSEGGFQALLRALSLDAVNN